MTFRTPIVRSRLAALIACTLIAAIVPISAIAEQGIAPGSGAVVTAGQPLIVRAAPGWDAEISYEIADGSYVTVWDVAQTAPDGTLWYPVDGGFVPVDAVTSLGALDGGMALYQEAAPEATTEEWVEPAASEGWIDPNTGQWVEPAAAEYVEPAPEQWVEPAAQEGWVDPNTGQWVEPTASEGWIDPNTGQWVVAVAQEAVVDPNAAVDASAQEVAADPNAGEWVEPIATEVEPTVTEVAPAATETGWVDPNTGEWVEPAAAETGWTDPNTGEWVEPTASETGWVDPNTGQWVEPAATESAEPAPDEWVEPEPAEMVAAGGPEAWGEPIGTAYISGSSGDGAVCRMSAQRGSDRLAVLAEGEAVEVRGEAVGEWQPVNCAGVGGYVNTSLISWEPIVPADDQGRRGNRGNAGIDGKVTSSTAAGNQIANFAMQYVGYPYAYAGEGPYAFDCSGFTKFVIQNTLGIDITHDMFTQIGMGQSVGMDELQPGDLVFFANTFRPGLSHAGIYIGNGQFVHAENEGTGVRVSDLNSDYYGSRWAGGTRMG